MNKKTILIFVILLGISGWAKSQISKGGEPWSFNKETTLKKSIQVFNTPSFDYQKLKEEDNKLERGKPFRYGKEHNVNLNPENAGTWQTLDNEDKVWQLRIKSSGAYSLSLVFNNYVLKNGSKIFLYSLDKKVLIGAFTEKNNKKNGWFSTAPIAGEEMVLELNVPAGKDYGKLNISGIIHDYKNTFGLKLGYNDSGSCNVNINCSDGDAWQDEKRAVVKMTFNGYLCTGSLLNNTSQDGTPYLLTAQHCISSSGDASSALFWFNYESENCVATGNPTYQTISSSDLISVGTNSSGTHLDFSLLELSEIPPREYNAYYAGWNRKSNAATNTVCIHHPQGDIKKISFDNDAPTIGDYQEGYLTNSHWNIGDWEIGTTEGGSSGSPLFDENHLIVGDLTGGDASCSYNFNDYYARFDISWDYYSEPTKQLKAWLDPLNSGVEILNGMDPVISDGLDASLSQIVNPLGGYCEGEEIIPEFVITNKGTVEITSLTITYQVNGGSLESKVWNGSLTTLETTTVTFDALTPIVGESDIVVYVTDPNSSIDVNLNNDTLRASFLIDNAIDARLVQIEHPNGSYCVTDSISPEVIIGNSGLIEITSLDVNYQINDGPLLSEKWTGNLGAAQEETVTLDKIKLPIGDFEFKAFISSLNCAADIDPSNDTLTSLFEGQDLIESALIIGPTEICAEALSAIYSSDVDAIYLWQVVGGEITNEEANQQVEILWDEWGIRTLDLNVSNLCNSVDAETFEIDIVEQGFNLDVTLEGNGEAACWYLRDCDGNIVAQDCDLPATGNYNKSICVSKGCYQFEIVSGALGVKNYSLNRISDNQVVASGQNVNGSESIEFILNASNSNASFNLYPNPSKSEIAIEASFIELYENSRFAIFNLRGSAITPYNLFDERKVIDISSLSPGFYIVKILTPYGEFSKKFWKP